MKREFVRGKIKLAVDGDEVCREVVKLGRTIFSTLVMGDDGRVYWHCKFCHIEVIHKERCRVCGRTARAKK